jgi:acetolactate synthase-1/2/3 large subunit
VLAAFTLDIAIIVNEEATTGSAWSALHASSAALHTVLGLTGGAITRACPRR